MKIQATFLFSTVTYVKKQKTMSIIKQDKGRINRLVFVLLLLFNTQHQKAFFPFAAVHMQSFSYLIMNFFCEHQIENIKASLKDYELFPLISVCSMLYPAADVSSHTPAAFTFGRLPSRQKPHSHCSNAALEAAKQNAVKGKNERKMDINRGRGQQQ